MRFTIVFFVNKVAVYEPALREKLLTALAKEEPLPEDCGDDPSLALLYESLVTLPRSIIYGGFRYLPREQLAAMTYQELRSLASRGRQEAIAACCAAVLPLQIEQYTLQHADPEERLKRALNIRGRWIKRWKRSKEEHAQLCRQLHAVGTAWTAALEHRVVYFAELEGIEDKAFLIASLVHVYEQASPAIVSKYYDQAIERLKGRIVSLDEESLLGQIRVNTLRAALYRHYRRPDGSVDGLLLDRKMKDPPREVADSARERREASEKQLLAELERLLPSRMRRRDRLRLLIELGFSLSDVSELDEKLRSEEDDKK